MLYSHFILLTMIRNISLFNHIKFYIQQSMISRQQFVLQKQIIKEKSRYLRNNSVINCNHDFLNVFRLCFVVLN